MRIVIIGAGNVAAVLGRKIKAAGHEILQVLSRSKESAARLGAELQCASTADFNEIDQTASLFLVAMSDAALNKLHEKFKVGDKIIVHTAGAVSKEVLSNISTNYGVFYPLQSLRKENEDLQVDIPLLLDANNEATLQLLKSFAATISKKVAVADDAKRLKLHVAAVVASNFTNHLYCLAANYCKDENLDFSLLQPLITETAARLNQFDPCEMQTGPAIRKDTTTLEKHIRILNEYPKLRTVYMRMTDSIMNP